MTKPDSTGSPDRAAHVDAGWTLVRWIGIPIVLVGALYFIQRTLDEKPYVVVTNHGPMLSPEEIARSPLTPVPGQPQPSTPAAPLVPVEPLAPPPSAVPAGPSAAPLQPISQPSPPYPARALGAEKEGVVRLRLSVAPDGRVSDSTVVAAEPPGWFERAAQDGVKRWRYEPSENGGTTEVDVEFKLK